MKQLRRHLTYANVMSTLAVFLVLGGATAFAVSRALPGKSVGARQLKGGAVTAAKLGKGAVTTLKLRKGAVRTSKLRNGAVTGAKVSEATLGRVPSATAAGTAAVAEGPVAFAHVSGAGTLLDGQGVTVANGATAANGQPAYYCFSGLPFVPRGLVATPDYRNETPRFNTMLQVALAASGGLGGTGCPEATQAYVHGTRADNDASSPVAFYVLFFK